jgi:hypothetical protein
MRINKSGCFARLSYSINGGGHLMVFASVNPINRGMPVSVNVLQKNQKPKKLMTLESQTHDLTLNTFRDH